MTSVRNRQWKRTTAYLLGVILLSGIVMQGTGISACGAENKPSGAAAAESISPGATAAELISSGAAAAESIFPGVTAEETISQDAAAAGEAMPSAGYVDLDYILPEDEQIYPAVSVFSLDADASAGESGESETIPAAYRSDRVQTESGTVSYLPDVLRNQNPYNTCWAFSALSACEASMIRKGMATGSIDLSERHLVYYFYNKGSMLTDLGGRTAGDYDEAVMEGNTYLSQGGNSLLTMWHLVSWCGAADEQTAPYSGLLADSSADMTGLLGQENSSGAAYGQDVCHVQNAFLINMGDMEEQISCKQTVKKLIMRYGALGMSYHYLSSSAYDCPAYDSYYQNIYTSTNHSVTVVGWDDDFPKEHFATQPPGDGAWLIRNSWGEETGSLAQNGYFWLSYYDTSANGYTKADGSIVARYAFVFDAYPADNYDSIYQYDGDSSTAQREVLSAANCFTADAAGVYEILRSVGIGVAESDARCIVSIYKNLTQSGNPTSGEKMLEQEVTLSYPGYHTIELNKQITLQRGETFSVVFTFPDKTGEDGMPLYVSKNMKYTNGGKDYIAVYTNPDEGVSFEGSQAGWCDLAEEARAVFRIKAYTDSVSADTADTSSLLFSYTEAELSEEETLQLTTAVVSGNEIREGELTWASSDPSVCTVTASDDGKSAQVTAKAEGTAEITAQGDGRSARCRITVTAKQQTSGGGATEDDDNDEPGSGGDTPGSDPGSGGNEPGSDKPGPGGSESDTPSPGGGTSGDDKEDTGDSTKPAQLLSLTLNRSTASLARGKTLQLVAKPTYSVADATPWMVYWKSSKPSVATVTSYGKIKALKPGKTSITVYNGDIKATCLLTVLPRAVSSVTSSGVVKGRLRMTWKKSSDASGYLIYRSTSADGPYKRYKTLTKASVTTADLPAAFGSKAYYYKICAYKTVSGEKIRSAFSKPVTASPGLPSSLKAKKSGKSAVRLQWKKTARTAGYEIYRANRENGTYKKIKVITKKTTVVFTDTAVKKNHTYFYKIRAYRIINGRKVYGPFSAAVQITR